MTSFYICSNPRVEIPGVVACLYGYQKPRFFAILNELDPGQITAYNYWGTGVVFSCRFPGDKQAYHYVLMVDDNIDSAKPNKLMPVLDKAVEWYISSAPLDPVRQSRGQTLEYSSLADYTPSVPFMQVMKFRASGHYLLNYGFGLKGFTSFQEVQAFMSGHLKLSDAIVNGGGNVNYDDF